MPCGRRVAGAASRMPSPLAPKRPKATPTAKETKRRERVGRSAARRLGAERPLGGQRRAGPRLARRTKARGRGGELDERARATAPYSVKAVSTASQIVSGITRK